MSSRSVRSYVHLRLDNKRPLGWTAEAVPRRARGTRAGPRAARVAGYVHPAAEEARKPRPPTEPEGEDIEAMMRGVGLNDSPQPDGRILRPGPRGPPGYL